MSSTTPLVGLASLQYPQPQVRTRLSQAFAAASTDANGNPVGAYDGEGSAIGPVFDAIAEVLALDLQQQIVYIATVVRLSGCVGPDVDSFVNPWNVQRIPATQATTNVLFTTSSVVEGSPLFIPAYNLSTGAPGFTVQTAAGVQYQVYPDPANSAYDAVNNGYWIQVGGSTVTALVQCLTAGTAGNTGANTITAIYTGFGVPQVASISTVTNPTAVTNGAAAESDPDLKARFTLFVSTGQVATSNALASAVLGIQTPLVTYSMGDCIRTITSVGEAMGVDTVGGVDVPTTFTDAPNAIQFVPTPGYGTVVVNVAGTGTAAPASLVTAAQAILVAKKSLGITVTAVGPTIVAVNGAGQVVIAPGAPGGSSAVLNAVTAAYTNAINNIGLNPSGGSTAAQFATVLGALISVPYVLNIVGFTLNGGTADITAPFGTQLVCGTTNFHT